MLTDELVQDNEYMRETAHEMTWQGRHAKRWPSKMKRKVEVKISMQSTSVSWLHTFSFIVPRGRSPINPSPAHRFLRTGGFEPTSKVPTAKAVIVQWGTWRNKEMEQESSHPWRCWSARWWMPSRPAFSGFASTTDQMASLTCPKPLETLNRRHLWVVQLAQASCRIQSCPSPSGCTGALGAHQGPIGARSGQKWSGGTLSSPSSPSRSLCTTCIRSPPASLPFLSEPFPRGWHCSRRGRTPSGPKMHADHHQGSSSSYSPCPKLRPHCERWWGASSPPHRSSHHQLQ